jgi:CheY-like chemotaxis protein
MPLLALVIDDSILIRQIVSHFLEKRGLEVLTATDGITALETLRTVRPDVILTDLQMPRLGGHGLIEALKANQATADIPVLILAAKPLAGSTLDALAPATICHSMIYKDLNIDAQLTRALKNIFPS